MSYVLYLRYIVMYLHHMCNLKPVLEREREACYKDETLLTAAQHLRQRRTIIIIGNAAQTIC